MSTAATCTITVHDTENFGRLHWLESLPDEMEESTALILRRAKHVQREIKREFEVDAVLTVLGPSFVKIAITGDPETVSRAITKHGASIMARKRSR